MVVGGAVLLVLGVNWERIRPPESYWSQDKAEQYVQAFSDVHAAQDHVEHGNNDPGDGDLDAARERYLTLRQELDRARSTRATTGKALAVMGLVTLLLALLVRNSSDSSS
jgi:hypothetical protein